ncbi:TetR/AcrR family transcriptional regulator [Herbiconiux sp. P18]|uniref:TetR/AcrR family transcriptional regulator n=1 Tax=Herbiconiux liangxiaofengii TaxID=3342795 RepID=UPI0035B78441
MARPRRFDEERLLACALEAFWQGGYDRTSIDDISSESGVGNGSIYAAYGSKLGLFLAVFSRYCDGRVELVERSLGGSNGAPFSEAVERYLDDVVNDCTSHDDRRGCLMLNSLADLTGRFPEVLDLAQASIRRMEDAMAGRARQAVDAGRLDLGSDPRAAEALGAHVVLVSQGLIQLSRIGIEPSRLHGIAAAAAAAIRTRAA